jgi:hypothetical protein
MFVIEAITAVTGPTGKADGLTCNRTCIIQTDDNCSGFDGSQRIEIGWGSSKQSRPGLVIIQMTEAETGCQNVRLSSCPCCR